jgi:hypothetical protein
VKADVSPLVGRRFVTTSDNTGRIERIEEGATRFVWKRKPSEQDIAEFTEWVQSVLGPDLEITLCLDGRKKEGEELAAWRRKANR